MPANQPNILFIVVDDCGYADLGCTGQTDYRTPALDRLAAEGIRFTQAYANSALCTNTRVALITGRYQYRLCRSGWSSHCAGATVKRPKWESLRAFPHCRHCCGAAVIAPRLSGNDILDIYRDTAR